ncbi:MAG: CDP-glycerol glycerophosphotransferase family protein [Chloroflexi bacterium]|nr:CDP-glycerol glycerophosphotransferase family protein [Chloroflexota bacterium]
MSGDRKILFVAPRWQPFSSLKPHLLKLAKSGDEVIVLTKVPLPDGDVNRLMQLGCSSVRPLDSYLSHKEIDEIRSEVVRLIEGLPQASPDFARAVDYKGISLWQLAEMATFYPVFDVVRCLQAMSRALEQEKPDEIWAWQDRGPNLFWHDVPWRSLGAFAEYWLHSRVIDYNQLIAQLAASAGVKFRPLLLPAWFRGIAPLAGRMVGFAYRLYLEHQERRNSKRSNRSTRPPNPGVENGVMIMSGGVSTDYVAIPIAQAIENETGTRAFVARLARHVRTEECELLDQEGVHYIFCQEFATEDVFSAARKDRSRLVSSWREIQRLPEIGQYLKWGGISLWAVLRGDVELMRHGYLPVVMKNIEIFCRIVDQTKPGALVITNFYSPEERAAICIAHKRNIRTLAVPYFPLAEGSPPINMMIDTIALWGDDMKEFLIRRTIPLPHHMVITGNPAFEYRCRKAGIELPYKAAGVWGPEVKQKRVLFISQSAQQDYTEEKRRLHLECVYSAAGCLPDILFVVKLHPMESINMHLKLIKSMKLINVVIEQNADLYQTILASDLVVTFSSTAGFEAMLLDKPIIAINLVGEPIGRIPYLRDGAAYGVYERERLPQAIEWVLTDPDIRRQLSLKRQQSLRRYLYQCDGQSANRIAAEIFDMVGETR